MAKGRMRGHVGRYLISGILTAVPLWVTWLIFDFVLRQLSRLGMPWVRLSARRLERDYPDFTDWLLRSWVDDLLAALLTLLLLYLLGWAVNRVIGQRLLKLFEDIVTSIPMVDMVYRSVKKAIVSLNTKPQGMERVVLINFPSPEMKAVGLVTKVIEDETTGRRKAVVYVPTTPNPTSGYLEIVDIDDLTATDWSFEEAMNFVVSAGAAGPERVRTAPLRREDAAPEVPPR